MDLVSEAREVKRIYERCLIAGLVGFAFTMWATFLGGARLGSSLINIVASFIVFLIFFEVFSRNDTEYLGDRIGGGGGFFSWFLKGIRFFTWMPSYIKALKFIKENK